MTRTKQPTSFYLSPRTREQLNELAERTGQNKSELVSLYIDRAYREEVPMAIDIEHDGTWWVCPDCGEHLPDAPQGNQGRGIVQCVCGAWYRFDYWTLNRWPGDTGNTGLEPRRAVMHYR